MKKKVIVVHPERQHSYYTAAAIEQIGCLDKYITTVYCQDGSLTKFFQIFSKGNNKRKASLRRCDDIPDNKVLRIYEGLAFISLLLIRLPKLKKIYNKWRHVLNVVFAKKVVRYAKKNEIDVVIAYDFTAADILFELLKRECPEIVCILDVSIANRAYMKINYEKDMERTGSDNLKKEQEMLWNPAIISQVKREVELADYYFVPSNIVRESIIYCGAKAENIFMIPYGVNIDKFSYYPKTKISQPLKLIYVGEISYRKGLHHLLDVVSKYNKTQVTLQLAGAINQSSEIYQTYSVYDNISFRGFVTSDELVNLYKESDVFTFATLGEGYGLVVLEALSCGIPVICSTLAGGNDAIIDGYNGFVFEAGDNIELKRHIDWFLEHTENIPEMSANARKSVLNLTWEKYNIKIKNAMYQILDK